MNASAQKTSSALDAGSQDRGISEDAALRIALAAKALPDMEVRTLLLCLLRELGEPLTTARLGKMRFTRLKGIDELGDIDEPYLKSALALLKGKGVATEAEPLPEVQAYADGDMPESIRVACASNTGDKVDGHFGSCSRFLIYQISSAEIRLVEIRQPKKTTEDDDKNAVRAQQLRDCQVLYTVSIGGPAAAKVVRAGLHPIKIPNGGSASDVLQRLQMTLQDGAPPWLAKVMGYKPEQRIRFREEEVES